MKKICLFLFTRKTLFPLRGFTLVELLVVFAVIGILTTGSFAAFNGYNNSQTLSNANADVLNVVQTAKSRALSQVKPNAGACAASNLYGYQVAITLPRTYTMYAVCSNSLTPLNPVPAASTVQVTTKTLPSSVRFVAARSLVFRVITGTVESASLPTIISVMQGSTTKTVTISSNGTIQ